MGENCGKGEEGGDVLSQSLLLQAHNSERNRTLRRSLCLALLISTHSLWASDLILKSVPVQVYFSPNSGCQDAIVGIINHTKKTILVQAYNFKCTHSGSSQEGP
jgi:hypothetical protein